VRPTPGGAVVTFAMRARGGLSRFWASALTVERRARSVESIPVRAAVGALAGTVVPLVQRARPPVLRALSRPLALGTSDQGRAQPAFVTALSEGAGATMLVTWPGGAAQLTPVRCDPRGDSPATPET
jgi:hypothetical protein